MMLTCVTAEQQSRPAAAKEREGEALYSALPLLPVNHFTDGTTLNTTTTALTATPG